MYNPGINLRTEYQVNKLLIERLAFHKITIFENFMLIEFPLSFTKRSLTEFITNFVIILKRIMKSDSNNPNNPIDKSKKQCYHRANSTLESNWSSKQVNFQYKRIKIICQS
jgi:glycine cleavage system protein P-like pyridoxal-binding family